MKFSLKSKITTKVFNCLILHLIKNLECELCKMPLKERFTLKGQIIILIDIQRPEDNYIILEGIIKEKTENKYLYLINFKNKQNVKIGRSIEADVRISDISVSRNHAFIKLFEGNFYIQDNCSKFGTLLSVPENLLVLPNKEIGLQIGKTSLNFFMRRTCLGILKCSK